jgi:predicted ribosomally synthesized peptide with nif11-like leader
MSKESYQEFVKKLQTDTGLQKELRARFGDPKGGIPAQELAAFAASKGYKFGVEELKGELTDDQLGAVAGGAVNAYLVFHAEPTSEGEKHTVKLAQHIPKLI